MRWAKWWAASFGWPLAFVFWFQVIVVLFAARPTSDGHVDIVGLLLFQFLWIIIVCSYFSTVFSPPQTICIEEHERDTIEKTCKKCDAPKPPRAHHCKICRRCVRRMDHHCPILQTCIHEGNHKFFILFLVWPMALAAFTVYHGWKILYKTFVCCWEDCELSTEEHLMATGVSNAVVVGISVIYLLRYQLPNLLHNRTIVEDAQEISDFDTGCKWRNVCSVMGRGFDAFLPFNQPTTATKTSN